MNNVNTENTQVLMEYGKRGELKNTYTYGPERISNDSDYYLYDGRGSVSSVITDTEELIASDWRKPLVQEALEPVLEWEL